MRRWEFPGRTGLRWLQYCLTTVVAGQRLCLAGLSECHATYTQLAASSRRRTASQNRFTPQSTNDRLVITREDMYPHRPLEDSVKIEQLFVETLIDIAQKLQSNPSEYDLIKVAGLLRPILLENLLDDASSAASVDVRFRVVKPAPPAIPPELQRQMDEACAKISATRPDVKPVTVAVSVGGNSLSDDPAFPGDVVVELSRKEFLKHGIIIYNDEDYTVEHVVRVAANSLGGIHNDGKPNQNKRSEELRNYMQRSNMCGRTMLGWYISQIAECTLRACEPVADELARLELYVPYSSDWEWSIGSYRHTGSQP